jgi:hypothetical protein
VPIVIIMIITMIIIIILIIMTIMIIIIIIITTTTHLGANGGIPALPRRPQLAQQHARTPHDDRERPGRLHHLRHVRDADRMILRRVARHVCQDEATIRGTMMMVLVGK